MAVRGMKVLILMSLAWVVLVPSSQASPLPWSSDDWNWTTFATSTGSSTPAPSTPPALAPSTPSAFTNAGTMPPPPPAAPAPAPPPPPPAPAPAPTPPVFAASAPSVAAPAIAAPANTPATVDAFLNFGTGPYAEASVLTNGNAQPWYSSAAIASFFGGQPTTQQQQAFVNTVEQRVEQAFQLSGVPLTLTTDPTVPAAHMMSIVSGTSSHFTPNAIGETDLGRNGFNFIDQIAHSAQNLDQLEWILAHNISHELMLAFGVPEVHDTTGNYIDAEKANFSMMTDPNAVFSSGAVQDLLSKNFLAGGNTLMTPLAQEVDPQNVPEPATLAAWTLVGVGAVVIRRRRSRRNAA